MSYYLHGVTCFLLRKILIIESEDHKTYEILLLQNINPFKYLGITFIIDGD